MEEIDIIFLEAKEKMEKSIEHYNFNLVKISVGRANPQILNSIKINYYGELTPLLQIVNISIPKPRQLLINPYEINLIKTIVGVINSSSLGFFAVDEGNKVRITFPEVTTERRKELVKSFAQYTEQAKILIRHVRQDVNKLIKDIGFSKDDEKKYLQEVQEETNKYIEKINLRANDKKKELIQI